MVQAFHISNIYFRYLIFTDIPVVFHGSAAGISVDINPAASERLDFCQSKMLQIHI